jgi:hypothetical protein
MTSAPSRSANSTANDVFPDAVGPVRNSEFAGVTAAQRPLRTVVRVSKADGTALCIEGSTGELTITL